MQDATRLWIGRIAVGFAIFSLGYAAGKHAATRGTCSTAAPPPPSPVPATEPAAVAPSIPPASTSVTQVVAYYLHGDFRCATCNRIEAMAKAAVESRFAAELQSGRVRWRTANFQADESLAKRYGVVASTVVVARSRNQREEGFERLDGVWQRVQRPDEFAQYVQAAVARALGAATP
jgi:hypothetical protein